MASPARKETTWAARCLASASASSGERPAVPSGHGTMRPLVSAVARNAQRSNKREGFGFNDVAGGGESGKTGALGLIRRIEVDRTVDDAPGTAGLVDLVDNVTAQRPPRA